LAAPLAVLCVYASDAVSAYIRCGWDREEDRRKLRSRSSLTGENALRSPEWFRGEDMGS
jgi:hypothetical protein